MKNKFIKNKNKQAHKPDSVFRDSEFCHLSSLIIADKIKRPTRFEFALRQSERAALFQNCLVFQLPGFTAIYVTI